MSYGGGTHISQRADQLSGPVPGANGQRAVLVPRGPVGTSGMPEPVSLSGPPRRGALEEIFPPIADYAFLSDCENTCLVRADRRGRVALPAAAA